MIMRTFLTESLHASPGKEVQNLSSQRYDAVKQASEVHMLLVLPVRRAVMSIRA